MNPRTLWISVVVAIIVVWLLFFITGALLHWNGWGRVLANFGFLEKDKAVTYLCGNGGDTMNKWRDQVQSNWPKMDVETGFEMINLPTRPDNVLGRRHTT